MPDSSDEILPVKVQDKVRGKKSRNVRKTAREKLTLSLNVDLHFRDKQEKENFLFNFSRYGRIEKIINDLPPEDQLDLIESNPKLFKSINNPNEQFIIAAIKRNYYVIQYVNNPTDEMEAIALAQNTNAVFEIGKRDIRQFGTKTRQVWDVWQGDYDEDDNFCEEAKELLERIHKLGRDKAKILKHEPKLTDKYF